MDVTVDTAIDVAENILRHNLELAANHAPHERSLVLMFEGSPGMGKTTAIRTAVARVALDVPFISAIGKALGLVEDEIKLICRTIILAQYEATDLGGLPWYEDGEMIRLRPRVLPSNNMGVLFFDEVRKAKPAVHNVLGQVLLEGRVGEHIMAPGWSIVLASNERKDKSGDTELPAHIIDRLMLMRVVGSREVWLKHAIQAGIDSAVVWFIKSNPDHFDKGDEGSLVKPTPRSWEKVSDLVRSNHLGGQPLRACIEGTVGAAAGHAFYTYLTIRSKLPDPDWILSNPDKVEIPTDPQARFAMMGAVSGAVERQTMGGFNEFCKRFEKEVRNGRELCVFAVQSIDARDRKVLTSKEGMALVSRYHELVLGDFS